MIDYIISIIWISAMIFTIWYVFIHRALDAEASSALREVIDRVNEYSINKESGEDMIISDISDNINERKKNISGDIKSAPLEEPIDLTAEDLLGLVKECAADDKINSAVPDKESNDDQITKASNIKDAEGSNNK